MRIRSVLALALLILASAPTVAVAKVQEANDRGFVIRHVADVPGDVQDAWEALLDVGTWWDGDHTFSGDAENLTLDARAGGCFCEVLPNPVSPNAAPRGGVEHMRVVYVENARALRMSGALGPLQSDAVAGTMTFMLKPTESGTQVLMEYVAGGYLRSKPAEMSVMVDKVLGQQLARFAKLLGGKVSTVSGDGKASGAQDSSAKVGPPADEPGPSGGMTGR